MQIIKNEVRIKLLLIPEKISSFWMTQSLSILLLLLLLLFCFLGPHPWSMEVPRLGVELELQLQAYSCRPIRICFRCAITGTPLPTVYVFANP